MAENEQPSTGMAPVKKEFGKGSVGILKRRTSSNGLEPEDDFFSRMTKGGFLPEKDRNGHFSPDEKYYHPGEFNHCRRRECQHLRAYTAKHPVGNYGDKLAIKKIGKAKKSGSEVCITFYFTPTGPMKSAEPSQFTLFYNGQPVSTSPGKLEKIPSVSPKVEAAQLEPTPKKNKAAVPEQTKAAKPAGDKPSVTDTAKVITEGDGIATPKVAKPNA